MVQNNLSRRYESEVARITWIAFVAVGCYFKARVAYRRRVALWDGRCLLQSIAQPLETGIVETSRWMDQ